MVIFLLNLSLIVFLIALYSLLKKQLKKGFLFDVSYLKFYKYTIAPSIISIFNLIISLLFFKNLVFFSFLPLFIPMVMYTKNKIINNKNKKEYLQLKKLILPKVANELKRRAIETKNVSLIIKEKTKKGFKPVEVIISIDEIFEKHINVKKVIENEITILLKKQGYTCTVLFKTPYKKKNSLIYSYIN